MGRQVSPKLKVRPYFQSGHPLFSLDKARLVALLLGSILISLWLASSNVRANSLFQSPASPVTPAEANQPPAEPQPPAQPQPPAAEQPAPEQQPPAEPQPPPEQPPDQPQPQQPLESQLSPDAAAPTPSTQELEPPPLTGAEQPTTTTGQSRREREEQEQADAADESPNFILDQAEFIDTVVVSGAYIWLCCGVLLFLLVPVFMLVLYVRGRSKLGRDEGF